MIEGILKSWPKELISGAFECEVGGKKYYCSLGYLQQQEFLHHRKGGVVRPTAGLATALVKENDKFSQTETRIQRSERMREFFMDNVGEKNDSLYLK